MAHPARFERATFGFGGRHSIQLSYGCLLGIIRLLPVRVYGGESRTIYRLTGLLFSLIICAIIWQIIGDYLGESYEQICIENSVGATGSVLVVCL